MEHLIKTGFALSSIIYESTHTTVLNLIMNYFFTFVRKKSFDKITLIGKTILQRTGNFFINFYKIKIIHLSGYKLLYYSYGKKMLTK